MLYEIFDWFVDDRSVRDAPAPLGGDGGAAALSLRNRLGAWVSAGAQSVPKAVDLWIKIDPDVCYIGVFVGL